MKRVCLMLCFMMLFVFGCAGQKTAKEVAEKEETLVAEEDGMAAVTFSIALTDTPEKVFLAGNFNSWIPNDEHYALQDENSDGVWDITIRLAPGTYQYKFVVDNEWILPLDTPSTIDDGFGGKNGFIEVQ